MALYLGNNKVSMKSGYTTTGFKEFLENGGKFSGSRYTDLTGILKYEDTENITNMNNMFDYCQYLINIPLLNTSKVTHMNNMFNNCFALTTIPKLDTSKVTHMQYMFYNCKSLNVVPKLDVSNVTTMVYMFYNCKNLAEIHMTGIKVAIDIHDSTKFTREALVEILNNLVTDTKTHTLTMGSTNLAKLTDEDKSIATNKGWTLA